MMSVAMTAAAQLRSGCRGELPLDGRLEAWQESLMADPAPLLEALGDGEAPVNVIDPGPIERNGAELSEAAGDLGVRLRIFFARKANKCLSLVDRARELGHGVDLASAAELEEACGRGAEADDLVVTAAVKPRPLLELCVDRGATVVLDNHDEAGRLRAIARERRRPVRVAIRLAIDLPGATPTRFGLPPLEAYSLAGELDPDPLIELAGLHFHLDGYSAADRLRGIGAALELADELPAGSPPRFIDIGGGLPMSYLEHREQWDQFWAAHRDALLGRREPLTYENHGLGLTAAAGRIDGRPAVYPYFQRPTRGEWLRGLLGSGLDLGGERTTVAAAFRDRDLELRCEPGRSLLDGCGLTAARVQFVKRRLDGETLVGLGMNRTQCRSTSDDFMVDPILLPTAERRQSGERAGFVVGAYCIERELITLRRLRFPAGVAAGDLIVFPNTAGYLMHILESSSHRMPLARNYVHVDGGLEPDPVESA
jgi:diaminopimelate decarboxylase